MTPFALLVGGVDDETTTVQLLSYKTQDEPLLLARRLPKEAHKPVILLREHGLLGAGTRFFWSMEGEGMAMPDAVLSKSMDKRKEFVLATAMVRVPVLARGIVNAFIRLARSERSENINMLVMGLKYFVGRSEAETP